MPLQDFADLPYRPSVGIMLFNSDGLVFVGERADTEGDGWQMPQGGIDAGETPRQAALRELTEETGISRVTVIDEHQQWLSYDLPRELASKVWDGKYRGQTQKWFAMRFEGRESEIDVGAGVHPEFQNWKWVEIDRLAELIIPFKRQIYEVLTDRFRGHAGS